MIPTGWKECKLGDVLTLQRGFDLPERNRQKGNIPIVSSSGISGYHTIAKVRGTGVVTGRSGTLGDVFSTLMRNIGPLIQRCMSVTSKEMIQDSSAIS